MTIQDIASYAELLSAVGVIASLVFVGWQIRANTKAARLRMHEQVTQTYMSFLGSILVDPASFAAGSCSSSSSKAKALVSSGSANTTSNATSDTS